MKKFVYKFHQVFHCSGDSLPNEFMALLAGPSTLKTLVLKEPHYSVFNVL